jgi:two-component system, OmpR family, alkaline phosphatase synthesis response regulator PhoP
MMGAQKRILFVDDEGEIREVVQMRLESNGYKVLTASNGKEALEKVASEKPDLLILDIMMPELDGLSVLRALRKNEVTEHLPVIILSAKREESIGDLFRFEKISGYIEKPFDSVVLLDLIKKALAG